MNVDKHRDQREKGVGIKIPMLLPINKKSNHSREKQNKTKQKANETKSTSIEGHLEG